MIRMLHIVGSMSPSGIGNFIMNIYREIDREKVQFDFIVHEHREISFDDEIQAMGGKLFYVTRKAVSPRQNFKDIKKVVKEGSYKIVFRHTDTATVSLDLMAAKLGGAVRRIPHSHSTSTPNKKMHRLFQPFLNWISTDYFACSMDAGKWLYGHSHYEVIWNGIHIQQFAFSEQKREEVRDREGWKDQLVMGHVGNFLPVKNHLFLLEVFQEVLKIEKHAKLLFIGDGSLRNQLEEKAALLKISENVIFAGVRNDIAELLQAMDLFCFPSFYEGMPIALVEAQAAGLPCLISDTITDDVVVTDLVQKESLDKKAADWAGLAISLAKETARMDTSAQIRMGSFDVKELAKKYEKDFISSTLS